MTGPVLATLAAHWRRQPVQLVTLILGLSLATALWSAVQAINAEARASYASASASLGLGTLDRLSDPEGPIPLSTYVALRRAGHPVTPLIEGRIAAADPAAPALTLRGFDLLSAPAALLPVALAASDAPEPAELLSQPGVLFANPSRIAELRQRQDLPHVWPSADLAPREIVADIATAARLLGRPDTLDAILILPDARAGLLREIQSASPSLVLTPGQESADIARLTGSFHLNLTAFGLLSFAVGLFIVHGTIGLAVEQRRPMLRTLRALGVPLRKLIAVLVAELMLVALVAGVLGIALGYAIAAVLLPDVAATLRGLYGAEVPGSLTFDLAWAAGAMAISLLGAFTASAAGLARVAAIPLLASARPRAWAQATGRSLRRQALAGTMLLTAGILTTLIMDGLIAGFALLAGLLLGAALLLPLILSQVLSVLSSRAESAEGQWFWADTRQQVPGLSLALMALLLALAANIGVSTMVGSFRQTFTGWLDQRLAAELYVSVPDNATGNALEAWAAREGHAALPATSVDLALGGAPGRVYGVIDHATYRDNWPLIASLPQAWDSLHQSGGVVINEQLGYRLDLSPGERVTLAPDWHATVVGIYSDYGNPEGQALVTRKDLLARFPAAQTPTWGLRTNDASATAQRLSADLSIPAGSMIDQAGIKNISLQVFERTFAVTAALNVLTLGVAAVALLTALLTLSGLRLPQLAPVWALGLTRHRLAGLEMLRSLALATITFVLALPVGLLLAWALLAVVNVEAFGWRLPMAFFPGQWLWLLGLSLIAALAASALPVRKLTRTPPAAFLKVFANER